MSPFDYAKWYAENKEARNRRRKDLYHNNKEYREKVIAGNKASRTAKAAEEKENRRQAKRASSAQPKWKALDFKTSSGVVKVVTIGALAQALNRSIKTVRNWETSGKIPVAPYKTRNGERLYPVDMVLELHSKFGDNEKIVGNRPTVFRGVVSLPGTEQELDLYPVGTLAAILQRTPSSIALLELQGLFPATPLRSPTTNYRLYSQPMLEVVRDVVESGVPLEDGSKEIARRWLSIGMGHLARVIRMTTPGGPSDSQETPED